MDSTPANLPKAELDESQVARVIRRAAELDAARGSRVGVEDVRQIARELGITTESLDLAMREVLRSEPTGMTVSAAAVPAPEAAARGWLERAKGGLRSVGVAATGFVLGWIGPATNPPEVWRVYGDPIWVRDATGVLSAVGLGLATLLGLTLVVRHRGDRSELHFQLDNLLLWGAFTQGVMMGHGRFWDDLASLPFSLWFGFAVIGGYLVLKGERPEILPLTRADRGALLEQSGQPRADAV